MKPVGFLCRCPVEDRSPNMHWSLATSSTRSSDMSSWSSSSNQSVEVRGCSSTRCPPYSTTNFATFVANLRSLFASLNLWKKVFGRRCLFRFCNPVNKVHGGEMMTSHGPICSKYLHTSDCTTGSRRSCPRAKSKACPLNQLEFAESISKTIRIVHFSHGSDLMGLSSKKA